MAAHIWIGVRMLDRPPQDRKYAIATARLKLKDGQVDMTGRPGANPIDPAVKLSMANIMGMVGDGMAAQNPLPAKAAALPKIACAEPVRTDGAAKPDLDRYAMLIEPLPGGFRTMTSPAWRSPERLLALSYAWRACALAIQRSTPPAAAPKDKGDDDGR